MKEFRQKGSISDEDFMIHVLNNLLEVHDVILDGLKNRHTATGDDALTIDSICEKLNHRYEKIKSKKEEKSKKEKALRAYNKQYKQRRQRCGKYGHKPGDQRCPEIKMKEKKMIRNKIRKNKKFGGICYHCGQKRAYK